MTTLTGPARSNSVGFAIGNKGYISCGNDISFSPLNDLWEYTPSSIITSAGNQKQSINMLSIFPAVASRSITTYTPVGFHYQQPANFNIHGQELIGQTF